MKVYCGIGRLKHKFRRAILTIGIFDGVHLGHKYIIKKAVSKARKVKGTSILFTFYPHPYHILKPKKYLPLLISLEHRLKLISELGVDVCIAQDFTESFSRIDRVSFVKDVLFKKITPLEIIVGEDFNFGKDKTGDVNLLKKLSSSYHYKLRKIPLRILKGQIISSTFIRDLIIKGNLKRASKFLGRPVSVLGKVTHGSRRGKHLGFPTANIDYKHEVLPPSGVYAVCIKYEKNKFFGVSNIGFRPTFRNKNRKVIVEVHIVNFDKNIYGKNVEVEFIKRIRNEKKFTKETSLVSQINKDISKVKRIFKI